MSVTETLNEGLKRGFEVLIPGAEIAARVDAAITEVAPQVRMPGFRPGKVPGNLVRRMHGEALHAEAVQEAVQEAINRLLEERGLRPATQPEINLDSGTAEGEDVKLSLSLEVLPEVPEVEIEGIKLERLTVEPTEEEVTTALERLAQQAKTFEDKAKTYKAKTGDLVVMDYAGKVDGEAFDGGTGEDMEIELGSGRLIPGFEDGLEGAKTGEERELNVTFPEDYPVEDLKGKEAVFAVTVKAVKSPKVPEINEELATNFGLESLDKLKELMKAQVEQELNGLTRTYLKRKLLDHLAAGVDFDVPPSMVEAELKQIMQQVGSEDELSEDETADFGRIAERRVRLGLLLSEIGQKNQIQITQEEMNRLIAQEASRFPGQQQEVVRFFSENQMAAAQLRAPLFEEKVVDFLLEKAAITDRTVERAELEAAIEDEDETPIAVRGHVHGPDCDHDHDHDHEEKPAQKKKAAAKKSAAKDEKVAEEKAEKPAAKKPAAKKAAPKKAAAKDEKAEKPAAKKPAAKKPATKKPAAKKAD